MKVPQSSVDFPRPASAAWSSLLLLPNGSGNTNQFMDFCIGSFTFFVSLFQSHFVNFPSRNEPFKDQYQQMYCGGTKSRHFPLKNTCSCIIYLNFFFSSLKSKMYTGNGILKTWLRGKRTKSIDIFDGAIEMLPCSRRKLMNIEDHHRSG